jgi:hypothetical protein
MTVWLRRVPQSQEISALARLLPKNPIEMGCWILTATAAGICEEIIFRGYLQRQFWTMTGSLSVAVLLHGTIFGACHLYQGWTVLVELSFYRTSGCSKVLALNRCCLLREVDCYSAVGTHLIRSNVFWRISRSVALPDFSRVVSIHFFSNEFLVGRSVS